MFALSLQITPAGSREEVVHNLAALLRIMAFYDVPTLCLRSGCVMVGLFAMIVEYKTQVK